MGERHSPSSFMHFGIFVGSHGIVEMATLYVVSSRPSPKCIILPNSTHVWGACSSVPDGQVVPVSTLYLHVEGAPFGVHKADIVSACWKASRIMRFVSSRSPVFVMRIYSGKRILFP